jgi:hypothetical protein
MLMQTSLCKRTKENRKMRNNAHLMIGSKNLDVLTEKDFMRNWKEVMKELGLIFKWIKTLHTWIKMPRRQRRHRRAAKRAAEAAKKVRKQAAREEATVIRAI